MEDDLANSDSVPVVLLGDFNAPSHLDYTESLREKNCGYANVSWPTSTHPTDAGMIDSFRVVHPDPAARQGITWSPIFLTNNGRPEPLDRIDFIYHKSGMTVLSSEDIVVGNPSPEPNHQNNEWTSDHAVVLTVFEL
jgi:endonuclease/exonuclease/phosphatase family metal-dependent hydrolase